MLRMLIKKGYPHQKWSNTSNSTSQRPYQCVKEPKRLLFLIGVIFEATYNKEGKFRNTPKVVIFNLSSTETVINWQPMKVLIPPIGLQDIVFNHNISRNMYLNQGFDGVEIGVVPERRQSFSNNIQAKRK